MQDSGIQVLFQGNNLLRIPKACVTIGISIISVFLSMILGTLLGIVMTSHSKVIRLLTRFYLEFIRIMPQLVLLFIVYLVCPQFQHKHFLVKVQPLSFYPLGNG